MLKKSTALFIASVFCFLMSATICWAETVPLPPIEVGAGNQLLILEKKPVIAELNIGDFVIVVSNDTTAQNCPIRVYEVIGPNQTYITDYACDYESSTVPSVTVNYTSNGGQQGYFLKPPECTGTDEECWSMIQNFGYTTPPYENVPLEIQSCLDNGGTDCFQAHRFTTEDGSATVTPSFTINPKQKGSIIPVLFLLLLSGGGEETAP